MFLSGFGEVCFMLEFAAIIKRFLVFWLDGSNAGLQVLAAPLKILVHLAELGFKGVFTPKLSL